MSTPSPAAHSFPTYWLSRLSFHRKLTLIVGIPSLVALIGGALMLRQVASAYERARTLERANAASSHLIQAAATQAKERGFTAAALSDPKAISTRQAISGLRQRGDEFLYAALAEAHDALPDNVVLSNAYRKLLDARRLVAFKRTEVDAALARVEPSDQRVVQEWFDTETGLILAEQVFGGTLFLAQNPYELVIQYNGSIKAHVFVASEFAGRERARVGRFIASGQPIPAERLNELQRWRGVVEENLAAIAQLRANPAMSTSVLQSIDAMEQVFLGDYQKAREAVYTASAQHRPYPLTTDEWIAVSTNGIGSIINVSDRVGEEAARISHDQAAYSLANVLLILGLMGLLLLAVVASVFVARHLTRRLGELRAAAERVSLGDYTQLIGDADSQEVSGDEFANLATVFNTMQGRVEAGVQQLRAEKSRVETKITERTSELVSANARLVALNAEKDTFLGICSHDLKNPLSGVIGLSDLLQADADDPAQVRSHAADILQSAEFMLQLVNNLLNIGAIEQGNFNLRPERVDLKSLAARIAESYQRRAAAKQIRLALNVPSSEAAVQADARALMQVVDNLVSNAAKFTPVGGEIEVAIAPPTAVLIGELPSAARAMICLSVRDTGPGLSAEDQTQLFQKYVRLSSRVTGGESSTGLGLSIVAKLVEAMGGTVRCESEIGRGSTFIVELPASAPL